ncbi:MAG: hypothetical protein AB1726_17555, partial [Planctomycetota bacterium]
MQSDESDHVRRGEHPAVDPFESSVEEVPPREGGIPSPSLPGTRNRPAEGARRITPSEILADHFQGSEAAGDFLGLDVELLGEGGAPGSAPGVPELQLVAAPGTATGALASPGAGETALLDPSGAEGSDFSAEPVHSGEALAADPGALQDEELAAFAAAPPGRRRFALLV